MIAKFVQSSQVIDYTPAEAVAAGDVVVLGDLIGIASLDIAANTLGALALTGCYDVAKASGEIAAGAAVYWDAGEKKATATADEKQYLGKAAAKAETDGATVRVLLNAPVCTAPAEKESKPAAAEAIPDLTDSSGGTANDTIAAITDEPTKNAVASIAKKLNAVLAALRTAEIVKAG